MKIVNKIMPFFITISLGMLGVFKLNDILTFLTILSALKFGIKLRNEAFIFTTVVIFYISVILVLTFSDFSDFKNYVNAVFVLGSASIFANGNYEESKNFLKNYTIGVFVVLLISMLERFVIDLNLGTQYYSSSGRAIQGFMLDPNRFGLVLNLAMVFSMELVKQHKYLFFFIPIFFLGLFFTNSRSAFVVGIANILIYLWSGKKVIRLVSIIPIVYVGISLNKILNLHPKFMLKSFSYNDDARFQYILQVLSHKPVIFGNGFNAIWKNFLFTSHNSFLEVYFDFGIVGFLLFFCFLIYFLSQLKSAKSFGVAVALIVMVYCTTMNLIFNLVFFVTIGYILTYVRGKRSNFSL